MSKKQCLVRVITPERNYVVYTDGSMEGFGENAFIANYHQPLVDMELERAKGHVILEGTSQ